MRMALSQVPPRAAMIFKRTEMFAVEMRIPDLRQGTACFQGGRPSGVDETLTILKVHFFLEKQRDSLIRWRDGVS